LYQLSRDRCDLAPDGSLFSPEELKAFSLVDSEVTRLWEASRANGFVRCEWIEERIAGNGQFTEDEMQVLD
jgi:hypothetical protein